MVGVAVGCLPAKVDDVLAVVARRARQGRRVTGITEEELDRGKGQLRGGLVLGLEDSGSRMSRLGKAELVHDELLGIDEVLDADRRGSAWTTSTRSRPTCSAATRRWRSSDPPEAYARGVTFDVSADAYGRFMGRFSEPLAVAFVDAVGIAPARTALDVGCGPGALTAVLVDVLGVDRVAAADPSAPFVAAVGERLPGLDVRSRRPRTCPSPTMPSTSPSPSSSCTS